MACERCAKDEPVGPSGWCKTCDLDFDVWSRRYATDILWASLSGTVVIAIVALALPILGAPTILALSGVFAGFGTLVGTYRWNRNRRRRQFLAGAAVPRAYLPEPRR